MPTKKEEDDLIKSQKESAKAFSDAAKELKAAALSVQENSLREELGLTKAALAAKIGDKILGNGFKRTIFNFMLDKKRAKQLQESSGLSKREYKEFQKTVRENKRKVAEAKASKKRDEERHKALKEQLGEEKANSIIEKENAENESERIARDMILAENQNEANIQSLSTAAANDGGETPAERDQERQENERWKSTQLDLLRQIAESITGSGGAGSSDSGDSGLTGLGAGIAGLGKGIGVFIKAVGSGAGKLITSLAKGCTRHKIICKPISHCWFSCIHSWNDWFGCSTKSCSACI